MAPVPPSGLSSTPYPPSSTTAATILFSKERSLTFASEWYFKPQGVKVVNERFEAELRKRKIHTSHNWNEQDQTFRVCCQPGDVKRVWPLFHSVLVQIIKEESGENESEGDSEAEYTCDYQEDPPMQSDLIESLEIWRKETGYQETSVQEQPKQFVKSTTVADAEVDAAPDEIFPEEIMYFKSRFSWSVDVGVNLDKIISDKDLKELEWLTGCQFVKLLNQHKIYIGGHLEEACLVAVKKLDNLRKYHRIEPYIDHLFYSEGEENFQVVLKPFADIRKAYLETTLLEHLRLHAKCNYDNLASAITVRIAPYDHSKCCYYSTSKLNIDPAVKLEDKDCGLVVWAEFKYSRKGEQTKHHEFLTMTTQVNDSVPNHNTPAPMNPTPLQPINARANKDANIQRWAEEVPEITPRYSLQNFGKFGGVQGNSGSTTGTGDKPGWDTYKQFDDVPVVRIEATVRQQSNGLAANLSAMRSAMSARAASVSPSKPLQQSVAQGSVQNPRLSPARGGQLAASSQQPRVSMSTISSTHPVSRRSPAQNAMAPTSGPVLQSTTQQQIVSENVRHASVTSKLIDLAPTADNSVNRFLYQPPQRSILDDDISVANFSDPMMKPIDFEEFATESPSPDRPLLEGSQEFGSTSASDSTLRIHSPSSEVATRSFHNTMNQRAPRAKPKPKSNPFAGRLPGPPSEPVKNPVIVGELQVIDPLPEFVKEITESFADMTDRIRGFRGKVEVQAEFGRIVVNNIHKKHITTKSSSDTTYATEALQNLLLSACVNGPDFTKVLTTSSGEVPFLLKLTNSEGKELWDDKVSAWDVKYEFCFCDNYSAVRFTIEIDAETFVARIKRSLLVGNIFIHGSSRHWDFRIAATGSENGRGLEEEYGQLATALELSLHVPANSSTPNLSFELEGDMLERFQLAAIRVHRICCHKSKDSKSILKVSEIHALDIQKISEVGKPLALFKCSSGPSDLKPRDKLGKWYEVSISSAQLNELLEQNEKLELGEEVQWTTQDLLDASIAQSLYLPACEMLKKMDGVGQHSHNGVVRSTASSIASQVSEKVKEEFW